MNKDLEEKFIIKKANDIFMLGQAMHSGKKNEEYFELRPSTLENCKNGLFSLKDFEEGDILFPYDSGENKGKHINDFNVDPKILNGLCDMSCEDYHNFIKQYCDPMLLEANTNVSSISVCGYVYYVAIKEIKVGEEIKKVYGFQYWLEEFLLILKKDAELKNEKLSIQNPLIQTILSLNDPFSKNIFADIVSEFTPISEPIRTH
jgi:hypothetical protein